MNYKLFYRRIEIFNKWGVTFGFQVIPLSMQELNYKNYLEMVAISLVLSSGLPDFCSHNSHRIMKDKPDFRLFSFNVLQNIIFSYLIKAYNLGDTSTWCFLNEQYVWYTGPISFGTQRISDVFLCCPWNKIKLSLHQNRASWR